MTLVSENDGGNDPSLEDLQYWANTHNLTHPVLADPNREKILPYLRADPEFTGNIRLPNMQLLAPGMVIDQVNTRSLERSDIEAHLDEE